VAILDNTPPKLRELLAAPPHAGERNAWLYRLAVAARRVASRHKVEDFLLKVAYRQRWTDRDFGPEIKRAVDRAFSDHPERHASTDATRIPPWPKPAPQQRRELIGASYCPMFIARGTDHSMATAQQAIENLFAPEDLVCTSIGMRAAITQPRDNILPLAATQEFVVANPMRSVTGQTLDGTPSHRCLDNACSPTSKRHQVVEFDAGSLDMQAGLLCHLAKGVPLVCVTYSGGKSLHGWFRVADLNPAQQLRFFRYAVYLGADASLWDPAKLVRMPGGQRSNGKLQSILWLQTIQ
jgi:hypothetical protein